MSFILSLETATSVCSVALHRSGELVAHMEVCIGRSHAEALMSMVERLLLVAQVKKSHLKAVAISDGPGSYTGLRIGASVAKGLCYGLSIPLVAVGTLEAMVEGARSWVPSDTLLCPTIDARRSAVYMLMASSSGEIKKPTHVALLNNETYIQKMPNEPMWFFGDGAQKCAQWLHMVPHVRCVQGGGASAVHMGKLAFEHWKANKIQHTACYAPCYLSQF